MTSAEHNNDQTWFYEQRGERKGPVSEQTIITMIHEKIISHGSHVWQKGFPDWLLVENTNLRVHLDNDTPPPLSGERVDNSIVWILAFAPVIGYFLEWMVAYSRSGGVDLVAWIDMANSKYWFITLILNIGLSMYDERKLKKAGHDTARFKGFVWIVPVYLYKRAKYTKQSLAYLYVWIASFVLVVLA